MQAQEIALAYSLRKVIRRANGEIGSKATVRTDACCHFVNKSLLETSPQKADRCPLGDEVAETTTRAWNQKFARRHTHFIAFFVKRSNRPS
jgi:hypothetical protein